MAVNPDEIMKMVRERAKLLPGEAQRSEWRMLRDQCLYIADYMDAEARATDDPALAALMDGGAFLARKLADKWLAALGGDFDFREHIRT